MQPSNEGVAIALEVSGTGIWEYVLGTGELRLSRLCLEFAGLAGFSGTLGDFERWLHPDDRPGIAAAIEHALAERRILEMELRLLRADGAVRQIRIRGGIESGAGGEQRLLGIAQDVGEQRALAEREASYRELLERSPDAIFLYRPGETLYINAAGVALVGAASLEQVLCRNPLDFIDPEQHALVRDRAERLLAHGESLPVVGVRLQRLDGSRVPVEAAVARVQYLGQPALQAVVRDLTERKRTEGALRSSQAQLHAALRAGKMGAWSWDFTTGKLTGDPWAVSLWGIPGDAPSVSWEFILDRIHPEDRERVRARRELFVQGDAIAGEGRPYRVLRPDGELLWLLTHAVVERDAQGRALRMVGVHMDVTERVRAEEARLRSQKLEALGTLAGGIAHDFNNILAAIAGNADLAAIELGDGHPARESIGEIQRASARAADLVRRILGFSRPQEHTRARVPFGPIVEEATRLVRATLSAMIEIRTCFEADLPDVSVDPAQIHQALVNLLTNAAQAIGAQAGLIEIRVGAASFAAGDPALPAALEPGRWVCCSVRDDGHGMDRATLARVFDPFFTTRERGGTGLGLSVVHGILNAHGGAVTAESEPGRGSSFHLWIPVPSEPASPSERPVGSARARPEAPREAHVLYVDDEPAIVAVARSALERRGFRVSAFTDPAQALAAFREQPRDFDVVVTDLAMPRTSGFDLASELIATRPDVPILLTSGYLEAGELARAQGAGVREVLLKPYAMGRLVERVTALTGEACVERADGVSPDGTRSQPA